MLEFSTSLRQKSDEFLSERERLLFAVAARPPEAAKADQSLAARLPDRRGVLAMTNDRLLWIRQSPIGTPTGDVLAQYRHDELAAVDWHAENDGGDRQLHVTFTDGSAASLQIR
ncbi:MAG: hypothetical protein AAGD35_14185 [Actinomycetota bacterium]